jgi:hypothetical protein
MDSIFFLLFENFHLLSRESVPITRQKMAAECRLQDRRWLTGQVFRDGVISVILVGLCAVPRSYCNCVAPWVMHKKRGKVNGKHVCVKMKT